ncbi:MAG: hypothetical protein ACETWD_06695 [Desulfatiglandales bacterium]
MSAKIMRIVVGVALIVGMITIAGQTNQEQLEKEKQVYCMLNVHPVLLHQDSTDFPEYVFDIWGSAPSRVVQLIGERVFQRILHTIKEFSLSTKDIATKVGEKESLVLEKLRELERYTVVNKENEKWISNIPLYGEKEYREAEKVGLKYAEEEADILREEIPRLKKLYSRTTVSHYFSWDEVSLIIIGAFLADFCVMDRIPFMPENFTEELQPRLGREGELRWEYTGSENLPKRFLSRNWKFYQNVYNRPGGGGARFGYYRYPDERRKSPPSRPESLPIGATGQILRALADEPLSLKDLEKEVLLDKEFLMDKLEEMSSYNPPAVVFEKGKYWSRIPIINESDFKLLLPELDKVAEKIFKEVVLPHLKETKDRARELGHRWPIPRDTYVRDKALQILVEEGLLSKVQPPPVNWNFGVWGWIGFMRQHAEVTENTELRPDSFLKTSISSKEKRAIKEYNSIKERVLGGDTFLDSSTPIRAFLTRMSGYYHSDIKALREVEVPSDRINKNDFQRDWFKEWSEYMGGLKILRVHLPEYNPKDGDIVPIYTGDGSVHAYFYYKGSWKVLSNTNDMWFWHRHNESQLKWKLSHLKGKQ